MTKRSIPIAVALALFATVYGLYALGSVLSRPVPAQIGSAPASLDAEAVAFSSESGSVSMGGSRGHRSHVARCCCSRAFAPIAYPWCGEQNFFGDRVMRRC